MSLAVTYELILTLQAPLLSQANGTLSFGIDTAMQRYRDLPVLSGSLIRGNVRHALNHFATVLEDSTLQAKTESWLGGESARDMEPNRAKVSFDFFWQLLNKDDLVEKNELIKGRRTRISMDASEKVADGALQVIEDCFAVGAEPQFRGRLLAHFVDTADKVAFEIWMKKALRSIPALGSLKGVGYGKLLDHKLDEIAVDSAPDTSAYPITAKPFGISLSLDRPLCLGKPRTNDSNRIVSGDTIPGNVLKAVIAEYLSKAELTAMDFDKISFTHAMPAAANTKVLRRPQPVPLSLATYIEKIKKKGKSCEKRHWVDVADLADPVHEQHWRQTVQEIDPPKQRFHLPGFQPDWKEKEWNAVGKEQGYDYLRPDRLTLVRTQIAEGETQVADTAGLFSIECCDTQATRYDDEGNKSEHSLAWYATVDLSRVDADKLVSAQEKLAEAFAVGLRNIGKTKANASVTFSDTAYDYPKMTLPAVGEMAVVTLMTDARILPYDLERKLSVSGDGETVPKSGASGTKNALRQCYLEYWQQQGNFELEAFYAQQQRAGGEFFRQHFQKHRRDYRPEWLTVAGSVFVLKITDDDAREALQKCLQYGLPAYADFDESEDAPPYWQQSPHLPEHGFGQIRVRKQGAQEGRS